MGPVHLSPVTWPLALRYWYSLTPLMHIRVADDSEFHSSPEAFGHMSPHCRFSDLGPFRLRIFSAPVGNRTRTHGDVSNPLEISMSSAMKGEPGLATGLTRLGALLPFIRAWSPVTETCVKRGSNRGQGPIRFLLLYRGSSPFTHCTTSAGEIIQDIIQVSGTGPYHTGQVVQYSTIQ